MLQRRLRRDGINSAEAFLELQLSTPTFIVELFHTVEFQAEAEAVRATMVAFSAAESEADLELHTAKVAAAAAEVEAAAMEVRMAQLAVDMEIARAEVE